MIGDRERSVAERVSPDSDDLDGVLRFGTSFVKAAAFRDLFKQGMALVEETAGYLDGDGRTESNRLGRSAALTYASESMRLTTRLMQIASWLLVQRAVAEGEITPAQAKREKERVKLVAQEGGAGERQLADLPERIRELIASSQRMHGRILHLDALMTGTPAPAAVAAAPLRASGTVDEQHRMLQLAFGT